MIIETIDVTPAAPRGPGGFARLMASTMLLVRRRLWRDRGPALASIAIVALAFALSLAGPRLLLDTLDDGAKDAVDTLGDEADLLVSFPVGNPLGDNVNSIRGISPSAFDDYAEGARRNLPGLIGQIVEGHRAHAVSRHQTVTRTIEPADLPDTAEDDFDSINPSDHPDLWTTRINTVVQFAMEDDAEWTIVSGRLPVDATAPIESVTPGSAIPTPSQDAVEIIEVALSEGVAEALDVDLGTVILTENAVQDRAVLRVVGIVRSSDPADPVWEPIPEALEGLVLDVPGRPIYRRGTIVVSTTTASALAHHLEQPFSGTIVLEIGSEGLTLQGTKDIAEAMKALESTTNSLVPAPDVTVTMTSKLVPALEAYPQRARAALAQMSIAVAGVIAVAAVVVALMARLLLGRRESDLALERARGASVASVATRLTVESTILTFVGLALGYVGARMIVGDGDFGSGLPTLVAFVALVSLPLLGALSARRMWTSQRIAANRRDRARLARAKKAKRLTREALAVVLAVAAVVTLRSRGILSTRTTGVDPFLSAAPILLALGVTVVVLRLYPLPMLLVQAVAKRTRGVAGVLTLAKARTRVAALPLLSLSLALSIAVSGGLLVSTIRHGQEQASWERVGGEVRIDTAIDDATAAALRADGLTVSRIVSEPFVNTTIGTTHTKVRLLAIDDAYVDVVASSGLADPSDLRALLDAGRESGPTDDLPALLSPEYRAYDFTDTREAFIGGGYVDFAVVGDATTVPAGWTDGPYLIVPKDALLAREFSTPVEANLTFVDGAGAGQSVGALGLDPLTVTTRQEWLDGVKDSALIGGVARIMILSVAVVGLLAGIGLLLTVLEGVKQRGLALSMLRTQGMSARYGWWLALTELAPLIAAAVVGGTVAGVAILLFLGDTLGLDLLAGGVSAPALAADTVFLAAVAVGVLSLLFAAVALEVVAHRRDKLSEVLRLGETR